jgi:AAA+ ATPase superfamily predicted ATPase
VKISNPYIVRPNKKFVNRTRELAILKDVHSRKSSALIIVSGRRRIGKTELIEQFFRDSKILKFEGIQSDARHRADSKKDILYQISQCCQRLAKYVDQPAMAKLNLASCQWL